MSGRSLSYKMLQESWNEYRLSDGSVVRIRPKLSRVVYLGYDDFGLPRYDVKSDLLVEGTKGKSPGRRVT